ncbi:hypothetical protein [Weissella cibaria]|uniref:hypothetical protein n=1 Tax=Weissella cibaria TaxID=137591 RepID=UPI003D36EFE5
MEIKPNEKLLTLLTLFPVYGISRRAGLNSADSAFWGTLMTVMFYGLWWLADYIKSKDKWQSDADKKFDSLESSVDSLSKDFAKLSTQPNQVQNSNNQNKQNIGVYLFQGQPADMSAKMTNNETAITELPNIMQTTSKD